MWLALGDVLHRFDENAVLRQTLPLGNLVHGLAIDAATGDLHAVTGDGVLTFDATGQLVDMLEMRLGDVIPEHVALDGTGGVWALAGGRLNRFSSGGEPLGVLEPPGGVPFVALAAHPRRRSAWVATREQLLQINAEGRVVRAFALHAPARALAYYPGRPLPRPALPVATAKATEPVLEGPAAALLAPADTFPAPASRPAVVFERTITFDYTDGTTVVLASTEDGTGELLSDDAVRVSVQNTGAPDVVLDHDFFDPVTGTYQPLAPVDLTEHFRPGTNTVGIEILDTRPPTVSTGAYYLVQPRDPYSRVLGGESSSVFAVGGTVDLASGNYVRREADLTAPAPGLGVAFTRTYNSFDRSTGAFGFGWSSPYDSRATVYADGSVEVDLPSGRRAFFCADGSGGSVPEPGVFDRLETDGSGWVLTRKTTLVEFHYDDTGRLAEITESHGNTVTLEYAGSKPKALVDPAGRRYEIGADPSGRVTAVTDPGGFATSYTYDENGDLTRYVDRRGGEWLYTYEDHRLLALDGVATLDYDPVGNLLEAVDPTGPATSFLYDKLDRLVKLTDALGDEIALAYDGNGNRTRATQPARGMPCISGKIEASDVFFVVLFPTSTL